MLLAISNMIKKISKPFFICKYVKYFALNIDLNKLTLFANIMINS